jgi:hypothetical protein
MLDNAKEEDKLAVFFMVREGEERLAAHYII